MALWFGVTDIKLVLFLVYVMYKSSKFQDASRTDDLLMLVYGDSKHFFQFMFELLLLFYAKRAHDSCGILFLSSFFTFMMLELFFCLSRLLAVIYSRRKSNP